MTKTIEFTTVPVEAARVSVAPEFLDSAGVYKCFGIRKALLWKLLSERKIRGVSIRQKGSTRGKRLFDAESIRAFLRLNVDIEPDVEADEKEAARL